MCARDGTTEHLLLGLDAAPPVPRSALQEHGAGITQLHDSGHFPQTF
jgi:hypothetical protein